MLDIFPNLELIIAAIAAIIFVFWLRGNL